MKPNFDNAGVAQVQARILALPALERILETDDLRLSFTKWMEENFFLLPHQQEQLHSLAPQFQKSIAEAVANAWEGGELILFSKEESDDGLDPSPKEILFGENRQLLYNVNTALEHYFNQVNIKIRYRR